MSRAKVPGYREGLNVYQTFTCPRTDSAWTSASLRMNCNVGGNQSYNHYYCIPNAERSHFVEFCYDRASMKTEKGNCWELGGIGYLNQVNCTDFVKGCPDYTYLSERVYKIPACLELNFSERCFTEDPRCQILNNSTKILANNHNNENTSSHLVLAVFITSFITALILLLVAFSVKHLRQRLCSGEMENGNKTLSGQQEEMKHGNTNPIDQQEDTSCKDSLLLGCQDNRQNGEMKSNRTFHRASTVELIEPCNIKGPISHLCCSKTNNRSIWVSNDRGQLGLINHSGKCSWSNRTCTAYSGHFTIATANDSKVERIYWVHKEKKRVYRFDYQDSSMSDTTSHEQLEEVVEETQWEPISILFSDKTWTDSDKGKKYIFVGKVAHNDAKITRYIEGKELTKVDDIHTRKNESKRERIYQYPAYLAENINGDICASDDNRCVVVVDKDYTFRFSYTGHGQKGLTPYGICTDGSGQILILDSCSRSIHILDQDGNYQHGIALSDYLQQPRGLCIEDNGRSYVGSYGSISVYCY